MATNQNPMSREEIQQKIVALAWKDEAFRKAFLADPKGQFEKRLGTKLPESLTISAHAEDADHLYFVIPAKPEAKKKESGELSDGDLEKVAGGVILLNAGPTDFPPSAEPGKAATIATAPITAQGSSGWRA